MTNSFAGRLRVAINNAGTIQKLGKLAQVAPRTISGYLVGKGDPSRERLVALADAAGVSVEWLAAGRGDPSGNLVESEHDQGEPPLPGFTVIPYLSLGGADAHTGKEHAHPPENSPVAMRREWLRARGLRESDLRLVVAQGDAMAPTIRDGDRVFIDISVREMRDDALYALRFHDRLRFRRLQRDVRGGVWVICDAPQYEDEHLGSSESDQLIIIGRAVRISRML